VTGNVIQFPKGKLNTPPQSLEEMVDSIEKLRLETAEEIATSMIPQLLGIFASNGIDADQHEYIKDVSMIVESCKSLLYKYYNIDHPFHEMIESVFEFSYNDDDTVSYNYTLPTETEEE
jgi:hypothetical protein